MEFEKNCVLCGTPFLSKRSNGKYCSPQCAKDAQRGQAREFYAKTKVTAARNRRPTPKKTLTEVVKEANAAGMHYGDYVAKYRL